MPRIVFKKASSVSAEAAPLNTAIPSYEETIADIKEVASQINIDYSDGDSEDGRLASALKESAYLGLLKERLVEKDCRHVIEIAPPRFWYDIMINGIAINLKLSSGGTDNAFNKVSIIYTITGNINKNKNINFNQFWKAIESYDKERAREPEKEYHYLVIDKQTGSVLLKSILDIQTYKSNPCNIMQINWNKELQNIEYRCESHHEKIKDLLRTIQRAVRESIASMKELAEADLG